MTRFTGGVRLRAALAALAMLAACSDDRQSPRPSILAPDDQPAFAITVSSSNFQQCANGDAGGQPCVYINGVLNASKSLYHESDVIAERFVIPGLVAGRTYELVFDYGWEKAVNPGHMNYDFIAGWNTTLGTLANPCGDPLGNGASDIRNVCNANGTVKTDWTTNSAAYVIPDAVFTTNAPLGLSTELGAAIDRFQAAKGSDAVRFNILGGSFPSNAVDNVTYTVNGDDVTGRITVRFTALQTTVMLLWGGHFADGRDYRLALWDDDKNAGTPEHTDNLTGAAGQSGAPFHFTQQSIKDLTTNEVTGIGSLSNNVQGSVLEPQPKANISMVAGATNSIGEPHTFTVTLMKDLDDGQGPVPAAGEHVDVTLTPSGGAVVQLDAAASTCDNAGANTDANGRCTITFTSNNAGTITGTASSTLLLGGVSVFVSTDGSGGNTAPVVKVFVAGTLRWLKKDGSGALLGGAVFTVCRTERWDSDLNAGAGGYVDITPDVCIDVTDNVSGTDNTNGPPADRDGTAGEFEVGGLVLGKYTVSEKTAPPGYILDTSTRLASLSTSSPSESFTTAFVNVNPDAFITIGTTATNVVGDAHTFTAVMTAIPNGGTSISIPDFTITVSPAPSTPGSTTCAAFDAATNSKTCTRTINSNVAGTFTANATATATIDGVSLTRDTDPNSTDIGSGPNGSGSAVKTYVEPVLTITKTPDNGSIKAGETATFTIVVSNTATDPAAIAKTVALSDQLLASLPWTLGTNTGWTTCAVNATTKLLTCSVATLAPGNSASVTVSALVPENFVFQPPTANGTELEMDGNLVSNGGTDWGSTGIVKCSVTFVGCALDPTGPTDDSFGNGTKEDTPVPSLTDGSIPPNKSDLLRFYVHNNRVSVGQQNPQVHDFLYLAWERVNNPQGTTNMDFEFNQSKDVSSNGATPVRTAGDILIKYDLSQGGGNLSMGYHTWVTSGACEANGQTAPCWGPLQSLAGAFKGRANDFGSVDDPINPNATRTLSTLTFGEASIDLQAAGIFQSGVCVSFGSAYLKSRSSDSFTAAIKDFVRPAAISLTNCQPANIPNTASVTASNATGSSDTGSITVTVP